MSSLFGLRLLVAVAVMVAPLGLAQLVRRRYGIPYPLLAVGVITFIGALAVQLAGWWLAPEAVRLSPVISGAVTGLLVGFSDVMARGLGYHYLARTALYRPQAVMIGIGHALLPMLAVGLGLLLLAMDILRVEDAAAWAGLDDSLLAEAVTNLAPLALHCAVSWLVLQTFLRNELRWAYGAMLWMGTVAGTETFLAGASRQREQALLVWWLVVAVISLGLLFFTRPPAGFRWPDDGSGNMQVDEGS